MKAILSSRPARILWLIQTLFVAFLFGHSTVLFGQISHSANFSVSNLIISTETAKDGVNYEKVTFNQLSQTDEIGRPCLPVKYVHLIVPSDQDVEKILITFSDRQELPGIHLVCPAQPPIPTSSEFHEPVFVEPDPDVYGFDMPYPAETVQFIHDDYFDGNNHIVTLAVYPLQYYPKSGRLEFISNVDFNLELKSGRIQRKSTGSRSTKSQEIYDRVLHFMVDNPEDIPRYQVRSKLGKTSATQAVPFKSYEYVVITTPDLKPYFEPLISWKARKGCSAGIVTTDSIFAHYTTDDISGITDQAGAMRQYLADCYYDGNPQTMWVLVAGDYSKVPIRYGCGSDNTWDDYYWDRFTHQMIPIVDQYKIPADLYFADFNGDWQVDGDQYTGEEHNDSPDYSPEIFVGRLLCSSSQDVQNWVAKQLKYELDPANSDPAQLAYLIRSFMMQSDQMQQGNEAGQVASLLPAGFINTIRAEIPSYDAANPTAPLAQSIITEMNTHYGLYSWFGHGEPNHIVTKSDSLNTSPRYCINTIDAIDNHEIAETADGLDCLANNNYPSLLYSISCNNTPFDDYKIAGYPGRNLGEGFTVITKAGGPAFLGNTRYGWVGDSCELYQICMYLLSSGTTEHIGIAEASSKAGFYDHYLKYSHNLVGCPETEMWTATPTLFTNVSITYTSSSVTVNTGVAGCSICVSSGNKGALYQQVAKPVSSYTFNTSVRPVYVTIAKHNYIPYTAVTGGTFTTDEQWFGKLHILNDIYFATGKTITVNPGTTAYFPSGKQLVVHGKIDADEAVFQAENGVTWYGITVDGPVKSFFDNCTIKGSSYGLIVDGSTIWSPDLYKCDIQASSAGIWIKNSGDPWVEDTYIKATNTSSGAAVLSTNGAKGQFIRCKLYGTAKYGHKNSNSATTCFAYCQSGRNSFGAEFASQGASIYVNGGIPIYNYGNNSILPKYYVDQYCNASGSPKSAINNYWGGGNPVISGVVTYAPILTTPPNPVGPSWSLPKLSVQEKTAGNDLFDAWQAYFDGEYTRSKELAKQVFTTNKTEEKSNEALFLWMTSAWHQDQLDAEEENLDGFKESSQIHKLSNSESIRWLCRLAVSRSDFKKAEEYALSIPASSPYGREILLDLAVEILEKWSNTTKAAEVLDLLVKRYPDKETLEESRFVLNLYGDYISRADSGSVKSAPPIAENAVKSLYLFEAYPNPFNLSVTINYVLKNSSDVEIDVYDILGRRVRTLAEGKRDAGSHRVTWLGDNIAGELVASGFYLCRIKTGEQQKTIKLLLIK